MRAKRVVLAYSGGVDTSVCIPYLLHEWGAQEVIALAVDLGQNEDMEQIRQKALTSGAVAAYVADGKASFVTDYIWPSLAANAMYEGYYPLATALARPLIARLLVEVALEHGCDAVAHGCTGKGNDQVRFDVSIKALAPYLTVLAPAREWGMTREETIAYGERYGIPSPVTKKSPYSVDFNLYGRSIECGSLEDPWTEPPAEIYGMTTDPESAPDQPGYVTVGFTAGIPVSLDGVVLGPVALIDQLNILTGSHGVGRIDLVEDRLVGIKSREIYECPAALVLIASHRALEAMTLTREVSLYKQQHIEPTYAQLVYNGLWYSPLRQALDGFLTSTQATVTGEVRLKLFKGQATVVGRRSPQSLYDNGLATYAQGDSFDHRAAEGFIYVWGLPTKVWSAVHRP
ncbi:argininosuccinate synthase [Candidatus Cyanaurora vandensis]|uniref:argininosuccinate synthase n=1 Tax=Candidatus Cyanaurora vandensis TaxID=2714958 RepID=UPI002579934E|nr:argininosuccinate synthase [Candidatus Cyanaurora vandensis]